MSNDGIGSRGFRIRYVSLHCGFFKLLILISRLVRINTSIPVPRVLSWSSDCTNPVGAEYIIMEKAAGVPLFRRWANMKEIERLELIKNLTKFEAQLSAIRFPAYGGLYLRADASVLKFHHQLLDESIDPSSSFCIGPSCDRSFLNQDINQGPCKYHRLSRWYQLITA